MNPPHIAQDPQAVHAQVCSLVGEVGLIALYPVVGVGLREMPVPGAQLTDEVIRVKALITFRVLLYCSHKCGVNVGTAGHDLHSFYCFYIQ